MNQHIIQKQNFLFCIILAVDSDSDQTGNKMIFRSHLIIDGG